MKIGIDIRMIGKKRTGDEAVFFNLVKNLAQIDNSNNYQLFTDTKETNVLEKIKKDLELNNKSNFEIVALTPTLSQWARGFSRFTWNFWTLPKYLRRNPVDIYLTQYITPFFIPRRIKIATIIHDISFNFYPQLIKFSDLFFLKILIPLSLRRADKIITVSEFTKNEVEKYYKITPEKVFTAYNAVEDNFLADITQEKLDSVRKKYNLPEKFILYLGTMQPRKNLPILIEAFGKIRQEMPDIKLVLAGGKGHNYDKEIDLTIISNSLESEVIFPGFIDEEDKPAVYKLATVFCFPSLYEGFGIPILEAMAVGTPVIASEIPPHKEIAGEAAIFFDPQNSNNLAEKIADILKNNELEKELARQGKEQAQKFSWAKSAKKILDVFRDSL